MNIINVAQSVGLTGILSFEEDHCLTRVASGSWKKVLGLISELTMKFVSANTTEPMLRQPANVAPVPYTVRYRNSTHCKPEYTAPYGNLLHRPMASTSPLSPSENAPQGPSHVQRVPPARAVTSRVPR